REVGVVRELGGGEAADAAVEGVALDGGALGADHGEGGPAGEVVVLEPGVLGAGAVAEVVGAAAAGRVVGVVGHQRGVLGDAAAADEDVVGEAALPRQAAVVEGDVAFQVEVVEVGGRG